MGHEAQGISCDISSDSVQVLNGIRPFLSVSGGSIEIFELVDGEDPKVVLKMVGPPLKSMAAPC